MVENVESVPIKKQNKNSKFKKLISGNLSEFLKNSSIHGIQYFSEDRSLVERGFWLLVLSFSVYACIALIKSAWYKWDENPTFISFRQSPVNIWDIPFPAVTVCSMYTMNRNSNFTFSYRPNSQKNASWEVGNASTFCDKQTNGENYVTEYDDANFSESQKWNEFLVQTSPGRDQIFSHCYWNGKQCDIFSPLLAPWGICFSFNMLNNDDIFTTNAHRSYNYENQNNISNWNIETNYPKTDQAVYPWRSVNVQDTLNFELQKNLSQIGCGTLNYYQIFLHHPAEVPKGYVDAINVQHNHDHEIIVQPDVTFTSENLKSYSPERRKCFYSHERKLHFFKIYTLTNCKVECLANYTLELCGCVTHYMPHNKTTILCAISNYDTNKCLRTAEATMGNFESGIWNDCKPSCKCLPLCNTITYNSKLKSLDVGNTQVIMLYKDTEFLALERQELFGDSNFWASCGGLLGLFTGFSVVSFVEIIYYLILKLIYNLGKLVFRNCAKF
ncbi:hypothetical protein Zmor_000250 [Zophobas morio]|uniref:Sodium channel protein Nach n=1 Tax=Zophobas morio TaxID=2755281 RepID=A0AA38MR35_9CUCU|nr:hypothetical protein Zmor_000250 [Zophobas morio]